MIFRVCNNTLMFFDKRSGSTGLVSDIDFHNVCCWAKSDYQSLTISLLKSKGLLDDKHKVKILSALTECLKPVNHALAVPESLHIELTSHCNLNCRQCYKDISKQKNIDYEFLKKIIVEASEIKVFQIAFGGGEPLLYPYLYEAVKLASGYSMGCTITTNGSLLTDKRLKYLKDAGLDHIQISLNGTTEAINNITRDGYVGAIGALELLSGSEVSFGINMTLSPGNISDLENMIVYAKNIGADNLNLLRYKPSDRYGLDQRSLSQEEYNKIKNLIFKYNSNKFHIKVDSAFGNLIAYIYKGQLDGSYTGCTAGRRFIAIDADGSFKVCSH